MQRLDVMSIASEWAVSTKAFKRNRMTVDKKVLAAALCNSGYSYRSVAQMLGDISYVAVRDAFVSISMSMPPESRQMRREVAIDWSEVRFGGHQFYLWLARDVDSGELLSLHGSPTGSAEDGRRFLASVGAQCSNRPVLRLGEHDSLPKGLLNLDLYFEERPAPSLMGRLGRLILGSGGRN